MFQDTSTRRVGDQKCKAPEVDLVAIGLSLILWYTPPLSHPTCHSFPSSVFSSLTWYRLFWLGTAAIAGYAAWYFHQHSVPIRRPSPAGHDIWETTKDAFGSKDGCVLINKDLDEHDGHSRFSSHRGSSGSVTSYDAHPGNPIPWGGEGSAYNGIGGHGPVAWARIEEPPRG